MQTTFNKLAELELLLKNNNLSKEIAEILEMQKLFTTGELPDETSHLKCISTGKEVKISARTGLRLMSDAATKKVFPGNIDGDFGNFGLNKPEHATLETPVKVFEITQDGVGAMLFASLNVGLKHLALTDDQIIAYCEENKEWLHPEGNSTLFLRLDDKGDLFLVRAYDLPKKRKVSVFRLGYDDVWDASSRDRLVVPQYVPVGLLK